MEIVSHQPKLGDFGIWALWDQRITAGVTSVLLSLGAPVYLHEAAGYASDPCIRAAIRERGTLKSQLTGFHHTPELTTG